MIHALTLVGDLTVDLVPRLRSRVLCPFSTGGFVPRIWFTLCDFRVPMLLMRLMPNRASCDAFFDDYHSTRMLPYDFPHNASNRWVRPQPIL